jgi:hypothetical protein
VGEQEFLLTTVFIFGVGRAFDSPTQQTVLPSTVPLSLFPRRRSRPPRPRPSSPPSSDRRSADCSTPSGRRSPTRSVRGYSSRR